MGWVQVVRLQKRGGSRFGRWEYSNNAALMHSIERGVHEFDQRHGTVSVARFRIKSLLHNFQSHHWPCNTTSIQATSSNFLLERARKDRNPAANVESFDKLRWCTSIESHEVCASGASVHSHASTHEWHHNVCKQRHTLHIRLCMFGSGLPRKSCKHLQLQSNPLNGEMLTTFTSFTLNVTRLVIVLCVCMCLLWNDVMKVLKSFWVNALSPVGIV